MSAPQIQIVKVKGGLDAVVMKADRALADMLPKLKLPTMNEEAREIFRAILKHEKPPGNSSVQDFLRLPEARGFSVHAEDWIPSWKGNDQFSPLYRPWVDWLAANNFMPYFVGNSLTRYNWDSWKPKPRMEALRRLLRRDRAAANDFLFECSSSKPTKERYEMLYEVDAGGSFYGNYPWQVPILKHFLNDKAEKVRHLAHEKLQRMNGLETEEAHAEVLAKHIGFVNGEVTFTSPVEVTRGLMRHFYCTTFETLAKAIGTTPTELAEKCNFKELGADFGVFVIISASKDIRSIIADRVLKEGLQFNERLFKDLPSALWERGLRATFSSNYFSSPIDFLDPNLGSLDEKMMRQTQIYKSFEGSVVDEVKNKTLPTNNQWDPLRALGLIVNKAAATVVLDEAQKLGMKPNNSRLNMLKFNLAL